MSKTEIKQINLNDVPSLISEVKYFDGEIGFADDIRSVELLQSAFKMNFVAIVFCTSGSLSIKIDTTLYQVKANDGMLIDRNSVVSDVSYDNDMSCKIIFMTLEGGLTFLSKSIFETFLKVKENPVAHFSKNAMELMGKYYELALFKMEHSDLGWNGKDAMHNILRAYLLDLISNLEYRDGEKTQILRQSDILFQRFFILLSTNSGLNRSVKYYADQLCVSPKYLSSICRKVEGKTASELITISTVGHIKQQLLYSPLSIKEIALKMGFENLSFFGKYVKKHLGMSPSNFRKQNGYGK